MNKNLNDNLYSRFGIELGKSEVAIGCKNHLKRSFELALDVVINPLSYKETGELRKIQRKILQESCRQMFLDFEDYEDWNYGFGWFVDFIFNSEFSKFLLRLQILINIIYPIEFIKGELGQFIQEIERYFRDFPILGITLKIYKMKSAQIFPATSKIFTKEVNDTLGLLEEENKYEDVLKNFESGLKEFLFATKIDQLKDVVEDMYTSCDGAVSAISNNNNVGFRNLFVGKTPIKVGLNSWQLKIFDQLRNWMDKIKHGTEKKYSREEVEQIILLVATFIRTIVNNKHKGGETSGR